MIVNEDITDRIKAEQKLSDAFQQTRALTARLMRAQDDERRRIAQMLHETTAQDLAALKMLLARLNRTPAASATRDRIALAESIALAEQSMTEVRTLSYLLHPPFLDEAGLLSALRWYVAGFAERSGIKVDLDLPQEFRTATARHRNRPLQNRPGGAHQHPPPRGEPDRTHPAAA